MPERCRPMGDSIQTIIDSYDAEAPLTHAATIPGSWYTDERILALENKSVFNQSWQIAGRLDQLTEAGNFITTEIADEPIVIVRDNDRELRGFFNVCRHHAAAVMTEPHGNAQQLRCPYHGWTYSLDGELKGTPDFAGVCDFNRHENGLMPLQIAAWEKWVFARPGGKVTSPNESQIQLNDFLGPDLVEQINQLGLDHLRWFERRRYELNCNWKVFVDNYVDGGYHVPHLHKGLNSVLNYSDYTIENGARFCLQASPVLSSAGDIGKVRSGARALYYWLYPNFMLNWYEGTLDTNVVRPLAVDRTEVIFDFYFADVSDAARERNISSVAVGDRIQREDLGICESVQRGLNSRAYQAGRLSVRREAGEHLFHRLLHADLKAALVSEVRP